LLDEEVSEETPSMIAAATEFDSDEEVDEDEEESEAASISSV
jgi:hypothetical protein